MRRAGLLRVALLFALGIACPMEAALDYMLKPRKVAADTYVIVGLAEDFTRANGGNIVNTGFIVTPGGVVVIDNGSSRLYGEQMRRAIAGVTDKPIRMVLVTHHHPDHYFGNQVFGDVPVMALPGSIGGMKQEGGAFADNLYRMAGDWMSGTEPVAARDEIKPGQYVRNWRWRWKCNRIVSNNSKLHDRRYRRICSSSRKRLVENSIGANLAGIAALDDTSSYSPDVVASSYLFNTPTTYSIVSTSNVEMSVAGKNAFLSPPYPGGWPSGVDWTGPTTFNKRVGFLRKRRTTTSFTLTSSGTTATLTSGALLGPYQWIEISGCNEPEYNGTFYAVRQLDSTYPWLSATEWKFTLSGTPSASPATGTKSMKYYGAL